MDILVFYGEFIYLVSKYEKRRAVPDKRWGNDQLISLKESVDIMRHATELILRGGTVGFSETERIANFINKNVGNIFADKLYNYPTEIAIPGISGETKSTLDMILELLTSIQNELNSRRKGYKMRVFGLLEKLHNLAD